MKRLRLALQTHHHGMPRGHPQWVDSAHDFEVPLID